MSRIAVVGASARAAAYSLWRAGHEPIAADLFADEDLRRLGSVTRIKNYPHGLADWLREVGADAWLYTGALENYPRLVDTMRAYCPLLGNEGNVLRRVRSPWCLADALASAGLLFPETRSSSQGLPRDGTWLAKTYRGSSGSGVSRLTDTPHEEAVYQQRIDGDLLAATFVAAEGAARLLGVTRQWVGTPWLHAGPFQYAGSISLPGDSAKGPLSKKVLETIRQIGNQLASQFSLRGIFGVDLMIEQEKVWTLEVNPRITASVEILEREANLQAMAIHLAACLEHRLPPHAATASRLHGKAILYANRDVVISKTFSTWAMEEANATPWPRLADVPAPGTPIGSGYPVLTLFAEGETEVEIKERLKQRVLKVEKRLVPPSSGW